MNKIGIIGIGNPLRKDDGLGIYLLEKLRKQNKKLPKNIDLLDGGTGGMNLLHILPSYKKILIIDAVNFNKNPGETKLFRLEDIQNPKESISLSTHEKDFKKILKLSEELDELPNSVYIFGIQPKEISFGQGFSEIIEKNIDNIFNILVSQIGKLFE